VRDRAVFLSLLRQQSFNEVLSPVNLCGAPQTDAVQGIPSTVAQRWIQADSGSVLTYDGDLVIDFFYDVRPCVAEAVRLLPARLRATRQGGRRRGEGAALRERGFRRGWTARPSRPAAPRALTAPTRAATFSPAFPT
jgi:hypothetical protein